MRVNPTGLSLGGGWSLLRGRLPPLRRQRRSASPRNRFSCVVVRGGGVRRGSGGSRFSLWGRVGARVRTFVGAGGETVRLRDPPCDPTDETSDASGRTSGRRP